MQVGILGPLVVRGRDGPREIAGARLRRLLVRLAVDPGRAVSAADLVDAIWSDDPPADPTNALQTLVSGCAGRSVTPTSCSRCTVATGCR